MGFFIFHSKLLVMGPEDTEVAWSPEVEVGPPQFPPGETFQPLHGWRSLQEQSTHVVLVSQPAVPGLHATAAGADGSQHLDSFGLHMYIHTRTLYICIYIYTDLDL